MKTPKNRLMLFILVFCWQSLPFAALAKDVTITKADGSKVSFAVKVAQTDYELKKGLMYVKHLDENQGMLFDFGKEKFVQMWMKNTLIPLDMLFIKQNGRIVYIAENTKPFSLENIGGDYAVKYVLEIGGGVSAKYGIKVGDHLK